MLFLQFSDFSQYCCAFWNGLPFGLPRMADSQDARRFGARQKGCELYFHPTPQPVRCPSPERVGPTSEPPDVHRPVQIRRYGPPRSFISRLDERPLRAISSKRFTNLRRF